ncbi:MAG TPA: TetR/AcrR family transcriptional regulator [Terriglobales bacterium]|nr:TetR/AcrR family transcriptional regulator [Terriglobales bacterium]
MATATKSRLGTRNQPEETRNAILHAAVKEFAAHGIDGGRTDAIARVARVNKALLYYYFKDKETLYGAALDYAFAEQAQTMLRVLERDLPPRQKILTYVGEYFDFIAQHPLNRNLAQREMMRAGHGSLHFQRISKTYFQPLFKGLSEVIRAGISSGEFRQVDPLQFVPSIIALVVFYFVAAPVLKGAGNFDPLAPERVAQRRAAVLDFISAALFRPGNPKQGGGL